MGKRVCGKSRNFVEMFGASVACRMMILKIIASIEKSYEEV